MTTAPPTPRPKVAPVLRAWPAVLAAVLAVIVGRWTPLISPLLIALIAGIVVANTRVGSWRATSATGAGAKTLLRWGVVLLGTRLSLDAVADLGLPGLAVIVLTVVCVFLATVVMGDWLRLDRGLVSLIASGFAICGAAAIAAVESGIRRRDEDVAVALAMVTLFGSVMILAVPAAAAALGMTAEETGIWAGASIHEVAQVIAAASFAGAAAVTAATTIKLGRVALLALAFGASRWRDRRGAPDESNDKAAPVPLVPWFLIGFVLAAAARSVGIIPDAVLPVLDGGATLLFAAGMFGLGLGIKFRQLFPMPWKVVVLSTAATLVAALVPLLLIQWLW